MNEEFIKRFKNEMLGRGLRVISKIGEGGMGYVYEVFDDALERRAALKLMRTEAGSAAWRERFRREAKFAARITHPGVAQVYQAGEFEGMLYYLMEFIDGAPLSTFLKKARTLEMYKNETQDLISAGYIKTPEMSEPYFIRDFIVSPLKNPQHLEYVDELMVLIADILGCVHELNSVHRDIKPSNIMITKAGQVKLVDFGLVKQVMDEDITQASHPVGTFEYMAPERFSGGQANISPAGDIYSLGVVFYELVTLARPFSGDDFPALIGAISSGALRDPREFNDQITAARAGIIMKCLSRTPSARFKSAYELSAAIKALKKNNPFDIMSGIKSFFSGLFSFYHETPSDASISLKPFSGIESGSVSFEKSEMPYESGAPALPVENASGSRTTASGRGHIVNTFKVLFDEVREEYFRDFVTDSVRQKLSQAFDINSASSDVLLMYYLFLNHGIITRFEFDAIIGTVRSSFETLDEREKLIFEAVSFVYCDQNVKSASAAGFRYMNLYPDNFLMSIFVCMTEMIQGNYLQALKYCDKITAAYDGFLLMHLIKADILAIIGELDKSLDITKKIIQRYPAGANYKFLAIQNLLIYGRLDEARCMLFPAGDESSDESYVHQRAIYYLCCGRLKESIVETRKLIVLEENSLFKSYHYYRLYRVCESYGDDVRALEYLDMANKLSPGHDFKNYSRIQEMLDEVTPDKMKPENISLQHFLPVFRHAKKICFKTMAPGTQVKLSLLSSCEYYHFEPRAQGIMACEKIIIYSDYHFKPSKVTRNMVCMNSVPVSPFISYKGEIFEASIKKCPSPNGSYYASVVYSSPQLNGEPMFFMTQFAAEEFVFDEKNGCFNFNVDGKPNSNASFTGMVVSFPSDYNVLEISCQPDEIFETDGRIFYFYTKFLFCGQKFSVQFKLSAK